MKKLPYFWLEMGHFFMLGFDRIRHVWGLENILQKSQFLNFFSSGQKIIIGSGQ